MKKIAVNIIVFLSLIFSGDYLFAGDLQEAVKSFDGYIENVYKRWSVPGAAVAIVVNDEIVYLKGFGVKKIKSDDKVDGQTVFQIGSCSKAFTAALLAMMVYKGYFKWQDKIVDLLPEFKLYDENVTNDFRVEDLLSQYSGLPSYSGNMMMLFGYDKDYIISTLQYIKPVGKFRKTYSYQNNLFLIVDKLIEKYTKNTYNTMLSSQILEPLNMENTSSDLQSFLESENKASPHYWNGSVLTDMPEDLPYTDWPYTFAAAGGINSTAEDMAKWLIFLMANKNKFPDIDKLFEKKVTVRYSNNHNSQYYCIGWRKTEYYPYDIVWHAGVTDGMGAYTAFIPQNKTGIVVLTNLPRGSFGEALSRKFFDLYFNNEEIDWSTKKLQNEYKRVQNREKRASKKRRVRPKKIPPLDNQCYVGKYGNTLYGEVEVKLENDVLMLTAGPKKVWLKLSHHNGNNFNVINIPGWRFEREMCKFIYDEDTKNISKLVIEQMTDGIDSFFTKID